jgi:hypothetical protein
MARQAQHQGHLTPLKVLTCPSNLVLHSRRSFLRPETLDISSSFDSANFERCSDSTLTSNPSNACEASDALSEERFKATHNLLTYLFATHLILKAAVMNEYLTC